MTQHRLLIFILLASVGLSAGLQSAQSSQSDAPAAQLPAELRGAKVYRLDKNSKPGQPAENPVIYKSLTYESIDLERLVLNLHLSAKPVDRAGTIQRIYFQDIRVNNVPVSIETFDREFKLSKKEAVDLPAPLKCSMVFSELDSLKPVQEIVEKDSIRITGHSFIEVKLNAAEKLFLRGRPVVIPVTLDEEVPLNLFAGSPLLQMAAERILSALSDPSSAAALALAKDHLAILTEDRTLAATAQPALYLLYCEYALIDPKTQAAEKFSQSGTGFLVSAEGKLLTAKRVVQPWKSDPQIASLMSRYGLEVDPKSYRLYAWPVAGRVHAPDGSFDFQAAASDEKATLKLLRTAPDRMRKQDYRDPDTGEHASVDLDAGGENDIALLQLNAANLKPLVFADPAAKITEGDQGILFGFPFGLDQAYAEPREVRVAVTPGDSTVTVDHSLNPGEAGAPLLTPDGKVVAIAVGANQCIPIQAARKLIQ